MIDRLIAALRAPELGLDLDWRDLADVMWLATAQQAAGAFGPRSGVPQTEQLAESGLSLPTEPFGQSPPDTGATPASPADPVAPKVWSPPRGGDSSPTPVRFGARDEPGFGLDVEAPVRHALADREPIGRALRPFMRRRPSRRRFEFDADATVSRFCDTGVLAPVMKPARERLFDVALVIDSGPSMLVWQETATALGDLLERHGAFRAVSRWHLDKDAAGEVCLRTPTGLHHSPSVLGDAPGQSIVLVLTDCAGDWWSGDSVWSVLRRWGRNLPVAILQPLAEQTWMHTRMGEADIAVRSHRPGQPNATLEHSQPWWWDDDEPLTGVVPIVPLHEDYVGPWARMVMGTPGVNARAVSGFAGPPVNQLVNGVDDGAAPTPRLAELLRSGLSTTAYELAIHLSAVEVSLPVAHVVMDRVLPQAREQHLAELVVTGVLRVRTEDSAGHDVPSPPPSLVFADGVRETLEQSLTTTAALRVWRALVPHLEATGQRPRFSLVLEDAATLPKDRFDGPAQSTDESGTEMLRVASEVAARLGLVRSGSQRRGPMVAPKPNTDPAPAPAEEEDGSEHGETMGRSLDRVASLSRTVLSVLDAAGHPPRVHEVDAGVFGVRKARTDLDLHGDEYYPYVAREVDEQLAAALDRRVDRSDTRMLLLVGEAMAGKSRTGAHALQTHPRLRDLPLLVPAAGSGLDRVADLTEQLIAITAADGAVLWLDDLNEYYAWLTESLAVRWRASPGLVVVATVRRDQLATLQGAAVPRAAWKFVNDEDQVEQVKLTAEWSEAEQDGLIEAPGWVQNGVAAGTPLGEVLVAARELLIRLEHADPSIRALVELVVDWQRTGIQEPLPHTSAIPLWLRYLPRRDAGALAARSSNEIERLMTQARRQACEPIPGTYAALLTTTGTALRAEDLLVKARTTQGDPVLVEVWEAALDQALRNLDDAPDIVLLLGYNAATTGQLQLARRAWQPLAEAGDTGAQYKLGNLLANRLDPPDLFEARRWYTAAAEAGDTSAQTNLGILLANRLDPPELDEARRWWTAAAEAGHTSAQNNLGLLLATRLDPPELDEARRWYTAAAEAGHTNAQINLGLLLATRLDPPELDEARRWWTAAAEAGDTSAQYNLGNLLTQLDPPELDEARRWYTAAAEAGHTSAQNNLGNLLSVQLDQPELDEARRWYTAAAEAGHTNAQYNLGNLLWDRLDQPELDEARRWYTAAAEAGHTDATIAIEDLGLTD